MFKAIKGTRAKAEADLLQAIWTDSPQMIIKNEPKVKKCLQLMAKQTVHFHGSTGAVGSKRTLIKLTFWFLFEFSDVANTIKR